MAKREYIVFDFDGTLYSGDCSIDFFRFMIGRKKSSLLYLPLQMLGFAGWKLRLLSTDSFKQLYFSFLNGINPQELNALIQLFWAHKKEDDFNTPVYELVKHKKAAGHTCVIITASPQAFVAPIAAALFGIETIGTLLEYRNGKYVLNGHNCKGPEKVKRFEAEYGKEALIVEAYSDNASDIFLFKRAVHAFRVSGSTITPLLH